VPAPIRPERRDELLERCLDYVLSQGLTGLSLRPLAAAAGTSARMLVYHFGSRERLVVEILTRARSRLIESLLLEGKGLWEVWRSVRDPAHSAYWRLLLEVYVLSLTTEAAYASQLSVAVSDWLSALPPAYDESTRTLLIAAIGGLLLDIAGTGQTERVDAAAALLFSLIERRPGGT
jgi:AcrR family transcriptional regulator